jgi:hypothetical protein
MSVVIPSLEKFAEKTAAEARDKLGEGCAVYVYIASGGTSTSSLCTQGPFGLDSIIAAIVQCLGDLRVRITQVAKDQAAAQAAQESRGQSPTGN